MSCVTVANVDSLGIRSMSYMCTQMVSSYKFTAGFHKSTGPITTASSLY